MARAAVPPGCPLTARQFEVLTLLCDGLTYKQAADSLGVSHSAVRSHVHETIGVLGVSNAKGAIAAMGRNGWWGWKPPEPQEETATPLAIAHPFLAAYLAEFEASRWPNTPDDRSRFGMRLALAGHRNQQRKEDAA